MVHRTSFGQLWAVFFFLLFLNQTPAHTAEGWVTEEMRTGTRVSMPCPRAQVPLGSTWSQIVLEGSCRRPGFQETQSSMPGEPWGSRSHSERRASALKSWETAPWSSSVADPLRTGASATRQRRGPTPPCCVPSAEMLSSSGLRFLI